MAESTIAGVITASATVLIALGGLVSALTLFIPILRNVRQVHTIVNQQRTDMLKYQRTLTRLLEAHGIEVPEDQSIDLD